jgi:hypothetical protein
LIEMTGITSAEQPAGLPAGAPAPCVVHLVRAANGVDPFRAFIDSYICNPAGVPHELVLLFKGFDSERHATPYLELADGLYAQTVFVDDEGFDLTAYDVAARRLDRNHYCFLNSFSEILAPDWLKHMYSALLSPGAGLVGATGSWGSIRSYARYMLGCGGAYGHVLPDRRLTVATLNAIAERHASVASKDDRRAKLPVLTFMSTLIDQAHGFVSFPAPHVRTSGFMIGREVLAQIGMSKLRRKNDAYRLESGCDSITAQVERLALTVLVVGRDGLAYRSTDWYASRTFWQADQENLLVADKQTADYERGDATVRRILSCYAWGASADPKPSPARPRTLPELH